ncbi:MAG: hypothetical protein GPJ51_09995 [Candidatus Heimdallarchaeota archaeon]|nr:hypothetical protein [Candidatus Heimdallarchaeota archaeon]
MTVDIAKKVSADFIKENLTNVLTSSLPFKRNLKRHHEFMLICLNYAPKPIRQSTAYKRLGKDRKYFQDIIPELVAVRLIVRQNKHYFYIPAEVVRKVSEGVRNPFTKSSQPLSLDNKFLTMQESYFLHAFRATCFHNLPEPIFTNYRGHGYWEAENHPNLKRFVFDPSLTFFDGEHYQVKMYKKKLEIYGPSISQKDPNDRQYKYLTGAKVGQFVEWFSKKLSKGKMQVKIEVEQIRFHETNRTEPFQEIANKFYDEGYGQITKQHWMYDQSKEMPEVEFNQGYVQAGGMGFGPELVDDMLFFPRFFVNKILPQQTQLVHSIQKDLVNLKTEQESVNVEVVKGLKLINSGLEKTNHSMENVSVFLDNLATKEDIEVMSEKLDRLDHKLEKMYYEKHTTFFVQKCDLIVQKLTERDLTLDELEITLNQKKQGILRYLSRLEEEGVIDSDSVETGKRGRPKKKYKLVK